MKTILEFHIGRGGRFYNPVHLSFVGVTKGISYSYAFDKLYPPRHKNGNEDLRTLDKEWTLSNGRESGLSNRDIKTGIGRINIDGDYNTTYTTYADDLSDEEAKLFFKEVEKFDGRYCGNYPLHEIFTNRCIPVSYSTIIRAAEKGQLYNLWEAMHWDSFTEEEFIFDYLTNHEEE